MVELHEESRVREYISAIVLATSIYFILASPYIIGMTGKNYNAGLENKVEYVNTK